MVVQRFCKPKVAGSNPASGTSQAIPLALKAKPQTQNGGRHCCRSPLPSGHAIRFSGERRSSARRCPGTGPKACLPRTAPAWAKGSQAGSGPQYPKPDVHFRAYPATVFWTDPSVDVALAKDIFQRTFGTALNSCFTKDSRKRIAPFPTVPIQGRSHQNRVVQSRIGNGP